MGYFDSDDFILSDEISEKIDDLAEQGNIFFDDEQYDKALDIWLKALSLIPSPHNCYAESVWFMTSVGDAYFMQDNFSKAHEYFENAYTNISGDGTFNPFIVMRLGQCCLEKDFKDKATEYLLRAYMLDSEVFEYEEPKYIDFLKENSVI